MIEELWFCFQRENISYNDDDDDDGYYYYCYCYLSFLFVLFVCDVVIEAIVENLKTKWELFSQVEKAAPSDAVCFNTLL